MSNFQYDDAKIRQQIIHAPTSTGLSVPGTAATATVLLRIPLVSSLRVNSIRVRQTTGGTAAGPNVVVGKSLAGTGAASAIGTVAFGTSADGAVATTTLTSTDFDAGDEIVLTNAAGTAASTPVVIFAIGYAD